MNEFFKRYLKFFFILSIQNNNLRKIKSKLLCRIIIGSIPANALFAITLFLSGLTISTSLIVTVYNKIISSQFFEYSCL